MENDLQANVRSWLEKQGYPMEMKVARAFREIGAGVNQSNYYIDPETGKPREIDVVARWRGIYEGAGYVELDLTFFIACKSQQKEPWIIFSEGQTKKKKTVQSSWFDLPATREGKELLRHHRFAAQNKQMRMKVLQDFMGYGITKAFESKIDIPYEAVMSAAKAATAEIKLTQKLHDSIPEDSDLDFEVQMSPQIAIPIVITDATLLECFLDDNNSPSINNVSSFCLDWKYPLVSQSDDLNHLPIYIYNVQEINQLLADANELQKAMFSRLHQLHDEQLKVAKRHKNS